jgi:hypothetical protein
MSWFDDLEMSRLKKSLRISPCGTQSLAEADGMAEPNLPFTLVSLNADATRIGAFPGDVFATEAARTELNLSGHCEVHSANS